MGDRLAPGHRIRDERGANLRHGHNERKNGRVMISKVDIDSAKKAALWPPRNLQDIAILKAKFTIHTLLQEPKDADAEMAHPHITENSTYARVMQGDDQELKKELRIWLTNIQRDQESFESWARGEKLMGGENIDAAR